MTHAIPTKYAGVQFRSRLEARWAAFFDLIGWKWEYEPFDLDGYIPDFLLTDFLRPTIVEVKPARDMQALVDTAAAKVSGSGWESRALLVGGTPALAPHGTLGVVAYGGEWAWEEVEIGCVTDTSGLGFIPCQDDYGLVATPRLSHCMRCGSAPIPKRPSGRPEKWKEAGNLVQYKGPAAVTD